MNSLLKKFKKEKQWVNWKYEMVNNKMTKVPYSPKGYKADSTKESDWGTFEECQKSDNEKIGIIFKSDKLLLGIDVDHCLNGNEIVHEEKEKIANLLIQSDTYAEISPSGTGLHLYFILSDPLTLEAHKKKPYEVYSDKRFFTFSSNPYKEEKEVRTITSEEALRLLSIIGYPWKKTSNQVSSNSKTDQEEMPDEVIIRKMFASKNGAKTKEDYNNTNKNEVSEIDQSLCNKLAFWTGKNPVQMERIWLASPLGQREKTQKRKDYRDRTIANAIKNCEEIYKPKSQRILENNPDIDFLFSMIKGEKIIIQNMENICRVLRPRKQFRYDAWKNSLEIRQNNKWKLLEDHEIIDIQSEISIKFPCFAKVGKEMVGDAIIKVSRENTYDSAIDYITSIKWDGISRLDSWLVSVYGVPNDEYHRKVGSNWFKGLVKRIIHAGCKFDHVLVLEGEQGIKKSTSLSVIGGDWHVETTMGTDNKDFFMQFQGKAIIEFSEGETLSRTEVKKMKAIITMQSDKYRPAYGRLSVDFPRRCVFAMTTNQTEYLKDETGNRRWLPVACLKNADIEWLEANRDQLYAEAYHRAVVKNETTWEFPEEETKRNQEQRRIHDPNTDLVCDWYMNKLTESDRNEGITVFQVYKDAIHGGFVNKALDKWMEMSISDILKTALKLDKRRKSFAGIQSNRWFPKDAPEIMLTVEPKKDSFNSFVEELKLGENKDF